MRLHVAMAVGIVLLVGGAVGCAPPTRVYEVVVVNRTGEPLAVGLVKTGPPLEQGWDAPEHAMAAGPEFNQRKWGVLVPKGEQGQVGPIQGTFEGGVEAELRVYAGDKTVEELAGYGRPDASRDDAGDPDRLDVLVPPGRSVLIVERVKDRLKAERVRTTPGG